jgi:hypothetical protein
MMMPPTIMVAATAAPTVMMATTAHMAMTMTAPDLDDGAVGAAKSGRCCRGHRRRCSCRSKTGECSKSNKCKFQFHGFLPVTFENVAHSKKLNVNKG